MIKREFEIDLTMQEKMLAIIEMVKRNKKVVEILLDHPKANCPFPDSCSSFPCADLTCNADVCSNGYAYRIS